MARMRDVAPLPTILFTCIAVLFGSVAQAQITNITGDQSPPIPGAGHDYIRLVNEAVNPATGSVSVRIGVPVPPNRGFTLPFSFGYDSNAEHHFTSPYTPYGLTRVDNFSILGTGGWSYGLPQLGTMQNVHTVEYSNSPPQFSHCYYYTNFVFTEMSGTTHELGISTSEQNGPGPCVPGNNGYPNYLYGADARVQATAVDGSGTNQPTAVTVADRDGTVYYFSNAHMYSNPVYTNGWSSIPDRIEDRNGNTVTISNHGTGAFTVTDSLGRTELSSSGFGITGNTLTVSGLAIPYRMTWANISSNWTYNVQLSISTPNAQCAADSGSLKVTFPEITAIQLPNGQSYGFSYDPTSGLLSKLSYPTGGYVRYIWGNNSLSTSSDYLAINHAPGSISTDCHEQHDTQAVTDRYVSFDGGNEVLHQHFAYATTWNWNPSHTWPTWSSKTTTVTTYDLQTGTNFSTVYTYGAFPTCCHPNDSTEISNGLAPVETSVAYYGTNGSLLRTVAKTYADTFLPPDEKVTLDNGQTSQTTHTYQFAAPPAFCATGYCSYNSLPGVLTDLYEYDYGSSAPGALLRHTHTDYVSFAATPIFPAAPSILDRPSDVIVCQAATCSTSNESAETDYVYDGSAVSIVSPPPSGHDETNYSPTYNARGNATTVTRKCFTGSTTCANPISTFSYDETGLVLIRTDPCGNGSCSDMPSGSNHSTTYSYTNSFTVLSGGQNASYTPSINTNAYLTNITDALGHAQNLTYDYNNGQLTASTDANQQSRAYLYNDPLDRPTQFRYPDGGSTQYFYTDTVGSVNVEAKKNIDGTRATDEFVYYDGVGHPISHSRANGESVPWDKTDSCYDGLGRKRFISYPYQANSATPAGGCPSEAGDAFKYDALSRVTFLTHSDNSYVATTYAGRATQVLDEGDGTGRLAKVSQVDALGRLVSLCEVSSSGQLGPGGAPAACGQDIAKSGFITTYSYDVMDDLLTVSQGALAQRTFTYDSLSRLLAATNPESGTTCNGTWSNNQCVNGYDLNSNLKSRTRPAPNQANSATTVTTTYQYDPLNRVTQRSYSDGVTPAATFTYDQSGTITVAGQSYPISNSIGRLSWECTGASCATTEFAFSYDSMGRINQLEQVPAASTSALETTYTYDLIGDETGDGTILLDAWTYNVAGRLTTISHTNYNGPGEPPIPFTNAHYDGYGHLTAAGFGDGFSQSWSYDARGRVQAAAVGTNCSGGSCAGSTVYRYTVGYAPNSDVTSSTDTVNGTWTYAQDDLNRLASSSCTANCPNGSSSQSFTYKYDRYSNRWQQNAPQGGPQPLYTFTSNNNHVDGLSYDAAGNLRNDGNHSYIYDAENRIASVDNSAATYTYDAEGKRVQQNIGSQVCYYLYDQTGRVVQRTGNTCLTWQRYVYVGNMLLGTYTNYLADMHLAPLFYSHGDWVGTVRARVDTTNSAVCQTIVSLPFGDGQTVRGNCATFTSDLDFHHFTGKERDAESNLDNFGARYNASSMGRFMTPDDPIIYASKGNPQSWNLYAYVQNNPINSVDPDGHLTIIVPGTRASGSEWNMNMKLVAEAKVKFHDNNVIILNWGKGGQVGGNLGGSHIEQGARKLAETVNSHPFAPGEQLNIIGHSRGGDVAVQASSYVNHKIDNLITLNTPVYNTQDWDGGGNFISIDRNNIGYWLDVTTVQDWVAPADSVTTWPYPYTTHIELNAKGVGPFQAHSVSWNADSYRAQWWEIWRQQQACHDWFDPTNNTLHGCL